jgi:hypothetical protein
MTDLTTYEGRRAAWAAEIRSGAYVQALSMLRDLHDEPDEQVTRKQCCCLGVACELIAREAPDVLQAQEDDASSRWIYSSPGMTVLEARRIRDVTVADQFDASTGFLPRSAQQWLGVATRSPMATLDQQFLDERDALRLERRPQDLSTSLPVLPTSSALAQAGDIIALHALNDAQVPFPLIAGLIERECLIDVRTGPVESADGSEMS